MELATKHTLMVGLNDKDSKVQEVTREQAINIIQSICSDCSITDMFGSYTHEDGTLVRENSLRVEVLFNTDDKVMRMAQRIKKELNQESIGMIVEKVPAMLV